MNELFGIPCIIASQKKQKKTSKYELINWFYKKIYGYEEVSWLPEGTNAIYFDDKLVFRDSKMFNEIMEAINKEEP